MKIFFSVGEPSGDLHGANLITQLRGLRDDWEFTGFGGPRMAANGCELVADLTELAVMWLSRVILRLPKFLLYLSRADRHFATERPDAVVLIDFPGFNWWVARRAKAHGIPVFYYGVPQLWAWAPWRVKKLQRLTDHVLCKLPFEPAWFSDRGCNAHFVGHPYFDELTSRQIDQKFADSLTKDKQQLVTLLPGSRTQEVTDNLQMIFDACEIISQRATGTQFAVASYNAAQATLARNLAAERGLDIQIFVDRTPELIAAATVCIACSGSVSLELLYHEKPSVIVYKVARIAYAVQDRARNAKFISLVNLLACQEIDRRDSRVESVPFPEYLTCDDESKSIATDILDWLADDSSRLAVESELRSLREQYAHPGASERAAKYINEALNTKRSPIPDPHFQRSQVSRHSTTS